MSWMYIQVLFATYLPVYLYKDFEIDTIDWNKNN